MALPTIVTKEGMTPLTPTEIHDRLLADVAAIRPGYTANLPGGLIEDISSTDVGAIVMADRARVELVNSLSPYGANAWLLAQLGQVYGVPAAQVTNTSVYVVFNGPAGHVIPIGFTISDGDYEYVARDGGVIGAHGQSLPIAFVATTPGSWEIPSGSVTEIVSSVPNNVALTCSNPFPGTPGLTEQAIEVYRVRVLQAGLAAAQGMPSFVRTLLSNVPGVEPRLIAIRQASGGWQAIVGGSADPYAVASAIYRGMLDVSSLVGSTLSVVSVTRAANGVVTTDKPHGYKNGDVVRINGAQGMDQINGVALTVTVLTATTFSTGVSTSLMGTYTGGGVLSPNYRNVLVGLEDFPDVYNIPIIIPPRQTVTINISWATIAEGYVNSAAIEQLAAPAIAAYVNGIYATKPMSISQIECAFKAAIASVLRGDLLSQINISVSLNGVGAAPVGKLVYGDPEGYFSTPDDGSLITVERLT